MQILSAEYEKIVGQAQALLTDEKDLIANAANLSALLFEALEAVDWVGIYFLRDGKLVLGPFQGRAAPSRLSLVGNAAGRVVRNQRSIMTNGNDIKEQHGDTPSQAQLLVPILLQHRCVGMFEIDSPFAARFNDNDRAGVEAIAQIFIDASDTTSLTARRASITELRQSATAAEPSGVQARERLERDPEATQASATLKNMKTRKTRMPAFLPITKGELRRLLPAFIVASILAFIAARTPLNVIPDIDNSSASAALHAFFCTLGFIALATCLALMRRGKIPTIAYAVAAYAFILSIVQTLSKSQTSVPAHVLDIACGLLGGYIGAIISRALRRRLQTHRKVVELYRP